MPGTVLRKVQPSKAVDLADPKLLDRARRRRESANEVTRLEARAVFLRRKAARLPKNSNGRDKAIRDADDCARDARQLRDQAA